MIKEAGKSNENPVISAGREDVALGPSPLSIFAMAGVASISGFSSSKKLGSAYLASTLQGRPSRFFAQPSKPAVSDHIPQ